MNIFTVTKSVQAELAESSLFAEAPPDFARDLSSAKVRRFCGSHNRLFMAFVIPHSWYFQVSRILVRPDGLRVRRLRTEGLKASRCGISAFTRKISECENVPPLVPSQASNADVQRAEGTGVTLVLPPVSFPFLTCVTHLIYYRAKFER